MNERSAFATFAQAKHASDTAFSVISRRGLLRAGAAAALTTAASGFAAHPVFAAAADPAPARKVPDVLSMSAIDMAKESRVVQAAAASLNESAKRLRDAKLRALVLDVMANPVPTIAEGLDEARALEMLRAEGLIDAKRTTLLPPLKQRNQAPQPYWSAPGSGYASHHAYPGGLVTHCALNVASAEKLVASYSEVFDLELDADAAVGGELLHDLHKPWVFGWLEDGTCRKEETLARTGEHHILSIAESMKRGASPAVVVAQACAHENPGTNAGEALVVGFIKAAAILAGIDPVKTGHLAPDGKTLPLPRRMEGFVVHLADHDFVVAGPACQWSAAALRTLFKEKYGVTREADLNKLRNYVLSNLTAMRLYGTLSAQGNDAFAAEVARVLKA